MSDDIDTRLASEVATLSTKLVTEVARLSQLEETVYHLRRENHAFKQKLESLLGIDAAHAALNTKFNELSSSYDSVVEEKRVAQEKNSQLEAEVEDLTASLFNEANEMVLSASRETYNFKVKNRKLFEELTEKDTIIADLQSQLQDLKSLFQQMEDQNKQIPSSSNTPRIDSSSTNEKDRYSGVFERRMDELDQLVYCPRARSIRFDLPVYQRDFKGFVYQISKPEFSFDLVSLKTLKYFRKIWTDEIEPSLTHVPTPTGNFINRWSTGKSFWSFLIEGKARIEPVSGVNETFKVSYKGVKTGLEVPIALREPCEFCGEHNELRLEYARLYNLKLYSPVKDFKDSDVDLATDIGGESHHSVGLYPLCNYCLVKLRAICEFFAKLRLINSNIYKIEPNSLYNDVASVSSFQFKRSLESLVVPKPNIQDEPIFVKLYLLLLGIRAKIYWTRTGFWDTEEDVECLNIDDIKIDVFKDFVSTNVSFQDYRLDAVSADLKQEKSEKQGTQGSGDARDEKVAFVKAAASTNEEKPAEEKEQTNIDEPEEAESEEATNLKIQGDDVAEVRENDTKTEVDLDKLSEENEQFHDTTERPEPSKAVSRKKSKSKAFKKKMNRDLDNTIEMLKENLGN